MKTFICSLTQFSLKKKVSIDTDQYQTEKELKNIILSKLKLKEIQFKIDNLPTKEQLNSKNDKFDLNITFTNLSDKIVFQLPNSKQVLIRIEAIMDIKKLIEQFKTKKIYIHEKVIEFLQFELFGIKIQSNYLFRVAPEGSIVYIKSIKDLVTISHHEYQFIFYEGQLFSDAKMSISACFKNPIFFEIQNSDDHKAIPITDLLNINIKYYVNNKSLIQLHPIGSYDASFHSLDVLTTIQEFKEILASIYSEKNGNVKPNEIILFDQDKKEITDMNATLLDFQYKFFFDIKKDDVHKFNKNQKKENIKKDDKRKEKPEFHQNKKHDHNNNDDDENKNGNHQFKKTSWWINFEFKSKAEFNFTGSLPIDTKMNEIASMIAKKYKINDSIDLSYKESGKYVKIDDYKSINDVKNHIRIPGKHGTPHNYLFVDIKSKRTADNDDDHHQKKKQINAEKDGKDDDVNKNKRKGYNDDDNDDSSSSQKDHRQKKVVEKDQRNKTKQKTKDENKDDDSSSSEKDHRQKKVDEKDQRNKTKQKTKDEIKHKQDKVKPQETKNKNDEDSSSSSEPPSNKRQNEDKNSKRPTKEVNNGNIDSPRKPQKQYKIKPDKKEKKSPKKLISDDDESSSSSKLPPKSLLPEIDDDDDNDDVNTKERPNKKKTHADLYHENKNEQKQNPLESYKSKYSFQFGKINKIINLRSDFNLKENERFIKLYLDIDENETLDFFILNDKNKEEEKVDAENVVMQSLKGKTIIVKIHKKLKANLATSQKGGSHKYFYQINRESKINEIILDSSATVLSLKEAIAEKNDVDDVSNIKVLFAGKDLLNDIVLECLELGSVVLYVYIRSMEDILLMTAKALKV